MNDSAKHIAYKILVKNKLCSSPTYEELQRIIESKQFTVIPYKKHGNSRYVAELIKKLEIENEIESNDSFFYLNNNLKFVFINSDISHEDKCALLRHELGHISNPNLMVNEVNCSRIKQEEFANDFAYNIKNPNRYIYLLSLLSKKPILIACIFALVILIIGIFCLSNHYTNKTISNISNSISPNTYTDNLYYVTSGGKKYHRNFCIIVKNRINIQEHTLSDAKSKGYKPCSLCIGNNE